MGGTCPMNSSENLLLCGIEWRVSGSRVGVADGSSIVVCGQSASSFKNKRAVVPRPFSRATANRHRPFLKAGSLGVCGRVRVYKP